MKVQNSENKLVITEEFIFDQNKLPSDPNNHFKYIFCVKNLWKVQSFKSNWLFNCVLCKQFYHVGAE